MKLTDAPHAFPELTHDLLDLRAEIEIGDAAEVTLEVRGQAITYSAKDGKLKVLGREAPLKAVDGKVSLRVLLDRTTIEVFANDGALSMSSCFLPKAKEKGVEASASGGTARLVSLKANELKSAWPADAAD